MLMNYLTLLEQIKAAWISEFSLETAKNDGRWLISDERTRKSREVALNAIKEDDSVHVILVSLKAGAQGLNLTCCSTVFIADLWWNPAIEVSYFGTCELQGSSPYAEISILVMSHRIKLSTEPIGWVRRKKSKSTNSSSPRLSRSES